MTGSVRKGVRLRVHLTTHPKSILGALLLRTFNITTVHFMFRLNIFKQFLEAFDKKEQLYLIPLKFF